MRGGGGFDCSYPQLPYNIALFFIFDMLLSSKFHFIRFFVYDVYKGCIADYGFWEDNFWLDAEDDCLVDVEDESSKTVN